MLGEEPWSSGRVEGSSFNYQRNPGMKKAILAFTILAALTSSSLAQSVGEKSGVNSALGIAPKTEDFIKQAAMSDMTEIEAATIAQQKGNADEKKFAQTMLRRSHQNEQRAQDHNSGQSQSGCANGT
jgi:predicted outer membrane protein